MESLESKYYLTIDLHETVSPVRLDVKTSDTARWIFFNFMENNQPWPIPEGTTATISDGTTTDTTAAVVDEELTTNPNFYIDYDENVIAYNINGLFLTTAGIKPMELQLISGGTAIHTSTFMLGIAQAVTSGEAEALDQSTLDDVAEFVAALGDAVTAIQAWQAAGYVITSAEVNGNNQLVISMVNGEGTTATYTSSSLKGAKGDDGNGIASIAKTSTSGLVDTYTITFTDTTTATFTVTNGAKGDTGDTGATGVGISSITKTGTAGLVDTYTITYTNGTTATFTVTNGAKGDTGATGNGISSIEKTSSSDLIDTYTITYTNGNTATFTVTNGAKGDTGATGTTFTPSVSDAGVISWTNDGGKENPASVNIKGPKGDTGPSGALPIYTVRMASYDQQGHIDEARVRENRETIYAISQLLPGQYFLFGARSGSAVEWYPAYYDAGNDAVWWLEIPPFSQDDEYKQKSYLYSIFRGDTEEEYDQSEAEIHGAIASNDPRLLTGGAVYTWAQNNVALLTSGKVSRTVLPDASTSNKGAVQLSSDTSSTSETEAATPKAVKTAYDLASSASATANAAIPATEKGTASGVAELDENGHVPSSQLPSYVDDVIEGYYKKADGKFYEESTYTTEIPGEGGKIYIDLGEEKTYRWSGSVFVVISETIALGETSTTAYRGDRGKAAYDHAQTQILSETNKGHHKVTFTDNKATQIDDKDVRDPSISAWARAANAPVSSVNGKTGAVKINRYDTVALTTSWTQSGNWYTQTASLTGLTVDDLVSIQLDESTIEALIADGVTCLKCDNVNGTATFKALGASPSAAITVQYELTVESAAS